MSPNVGHSTTATIELVHYHVGGDGERALNSFLEEFRRGHSTRIDPVTYDNTRLQVKTRILRGDPPDVWTGWPGENLRAYADTDVLADVSELYESTAMGRNFRDAARNAAQIDGVFRAIPYSIARINDLYVNNEAAEARGIDPSMARTPSELARILADVDGDASLFPMKEPWPVLQLWEVVLLGEYDHRTFQAITGGKAGRHRDAIQDALEIVRTFAGAAPDDAVYTSLVEANERFVAGEAPLYSQGDWAGGVFVDADGFAYGEDWRRIAFPGTEDMYVVSMDALTPSKEAAFEAIRPFLEYAGSPDGQVAFTRAKGSLPPRKDAPTDELSAFGQDQARALDRASEQPQSIAHGLSVTPELRIELLEVFATFLQEWDSESATDAIVTAFDE